jgi:hypothetical protein
MLKKLSLATAVAACFGLGIASAPAMPLAPTTNRPGPSRKPAPI